MDARQHVGHGSEPQNTTVRERRERRQDENTCPEPQEPREERERGRKRESMEELADSDGAGIVPGEKVVGGLIGHVKAECNRGEEPGPAESCCRASVNHEVLPAAA